MQKIQGWVEQGDTTLTISGAAGTIARKVQGSFPSATVTAYITNPTAIAISSISRLANVVTVTIVSASGFIAGQPVTIAGVADGSFDGVFTILAAGGSVFTYAQTAASVSSSGGTAFSTLRLATIYADNARTPKANPFTAAADGTWFFYAPNGQYDVQFSGGGIATPFTLGALGSIDENSIWADVTASPYFATGNGTTDDTAAIQAAFTALAATGGTVYFPPGTYRISSPLTISSNLVLQGSDSNVSVIQASAAIARMIDGRNKTGVTVERLKLDGNNAGAIGLDLSNSTAGASTTNRVYQARVYRTTSIGIDMDNNGDSTIEDTIFFITSGVSVSWLITGGNINMTRVAAANPNDRTNLAFQTCVLQDCTLRNIHITATSEQLRSIGGYYYNSNGNAVFTVDPAVNLRQADFIGTRFEITDVVGAPTGKYAIDGKFATGLFMTNPKFGNAQNVAGTLVFGPNFGSASAALAQLTIYGGTVGTEVVNTPTFNPSNMVTNIIAFVTGAGAVAYYGSVGSVGNDGTAGLVVSPPLNTRQSLLVRGLVGQVADVQEWQDYLGNLQAGVSPYGDVFGASVRGIPVTYANRPSHPGEGMLTDIIDCTVITGTVSAGGGSHHNLVIYNGTAWVVVFNLS